MAGARLATLLRQIRTMTARAQGADRADHDLLQAFLAHRDPRAFEAIIHRHGPMVMRLGVRALGNADDAEDVFQGTFLVLAQQAASIRKRESLASWLHGVAFRMANNARRAAARRRKHETHAHAAIPGCRVQDGAESAAALRELQAALDEETQALPGIYRQVFILSCLEQRSCTEIASSLGLRDGTVWNRLSRARKLLQQRLRRRGISLPAALAVVALSSPSAEAGVPHVLMQSTAEAAARLAAGTALSAAPVSSRVCQLIHGVNQTMCSIRSKTAVFLLLATGLLTIGIGAAALEGAGTNQGAKPPAAENTTAQAKPQSPDKIAQPTGRVDLYGDALPPGAIARLGTVRLRHAGMFDFLLLPDGKSILSAGRDRVVRHWQLETGRQTRAVKLQGKLGPGMPTALSPDARVFAGHDQGRITIWEVESGRELKTLPAPRQHQMENLFFSPDSKVLAMLTYRPEVTFWDWDEGKKRRLECPPRRIGMDSSLHGHFSPDGKWFAAGGGWNEPLCVFDFTSGRELFRFQCNASTSVFSPDSRRLIVSSMTKGEDDRETTIRVFELATGLEAVQYPMGFNVPFHSLAVSPDGRRIACGSSDRGRVLDIANGHTLYSLPDRPWSMSFSADGKTLLATTGHRIRVFDATTGKEHQDRPGDLGWTPALAMSPNGQRLASADWLDQAVSLWGTQTGRLIQCLSLKADEGRYVRDLWFSADGSTLAACQHNGHVQFWDVATGTEQQAVELRDPGHPHPDSVYFYQLYLSPDGQHVCTLERMMSDSPETTRLALWDLATGRITHQLRLPGEVKTCAWLADRSQVAVCLEDGLKLIDVCSGTPLFTIPGIAIGDKVAASADGRLLAARRTINAKGAPNAVGIWEAATGKEVATVLTGKLEHFCLTPNNRCLVATDGGCLCVWDLATGKELLRQPLPEAVTDSWGDTFVSHLLVSPDGRTAVTTLADGSALIWDLKLALAAADPTGDQQLDEWWKALAGEDAKKAHLAIWSLIDRPNQTVTLLRKRLTAVPKVDQKHVQGLIAKLGNDKFSEREAASKQLAALEEIALPALRAASKEDAPADKRRRIDALLARPATVSHAETLRRIRAIEVLEHIGTPAARDILKTLAAGEENARATQEAKESLARLSKKSP